MKILLRYNRTRQKQEHSNIMPLEIKKKKKAFFNHREH